MWSKYFFCNRADGNELAIDFAGSEIAHRALKTELSSSIGHGDFTSG
jgi:hypothetical protein